MMKKICGIIGAVALVWSLVGVESGYPSGESRARSLGLAGSFTTLASGVEAPFWNPANLGLPENPGFSFNLFSLGAKFGNNSFSVKDYNHYNGKFLVESDKQEILSSIPRTGLDLNLDLEASAVGFSWRQFAVTSQLTGASFLTLPREPFELVLLGNKLDQSIIVDQANSEACAYFSLVFSHGRRILRIKEKEIYAGINLKWIRGMAYQRTAKAQADFITRETEIEGGANFVSLQAMGGKGYAVDFGLASHLDDKYTLGLFVLNPLSRIKWNKEAEKKGYEIAVNSFTLESSNNDSVVREDNYTEELSSFHTHLSPVMSFGLSRTTSRLVLAVGWEQGFKNCAGSSKNPRLSCGFEYYLLSWLPLRSGISLGGKEGFLFAGGLGIDLGSSHLDFGLSTQNALLPSHGKGISLAVTCWFKIK